MLTIVASAGKLPAMSNATRARRIPGSFVTPTNMYCPAPLLLPPFESSYRVLSLDGGIVTVPWPCAEMIPPVVTVANAITITASLANFVALASLSRNESMVRGIMSILSALLLKSSRRQV